MQKVKMTPEFSDDGTYFYFQGSECFDELFERIFQTTGDTDIMLFGADLCKVFWEESLTKSLGCYVQYGKFRVKFNHKFSEQCLAGGRSAAYNEVMKGRFCDPILTPIEIDTMDKLDLFNKDVWYSFDIETGGHTGIRCISFYADPNSSECPNCFYIDCTDIKINRDKVNMIRKLFTSGMMFVAHYGVHDVGEICKRFKIPRFRLLYDTMWFNNPFEFRNLGYLSGVIFGSKLYKDKLYEANAKKDFKLLVNYCCTDSYYTAHLYNFIKARKLKLNDKLLNQVIYLMLNPTEIEYEHSIFDIYPEWKELSKSKLKEKMAEVPSEHINLFLKTSKKPYLKLDYSCLGGFGLSIPDDCKCKYEDVWVLGANKEQSIDEIKANNKRFSDVSSVVYRDLHNIDPVHSFGTDYDGDYLPLLFANNECSVFAHEIEGAFKAKFKEVRELL